MIGIRRNHIYLKPGELCLSTCSMKITTVLGSCIATTMFHRKSGIGAICHAVQPECRYKPNCDRLCAEKFKYVTCVIPEMIQRMFGFGAKTDDLEIKLFGGANILERSKEIGRAKSVGQQNVEAAMKVIEKNGLKLKVVDVGGVQGRKVIFETRSGDVMLKRLTRSYGFK